MKISDRNINIVESAYCPHCRAVTNLFMQVSLRFVSEDDGREIPVASRTYHCESCNSFVRSEDDEPFPEMK